MSDTFTASNGVEIEIAPEGHLLMPPAAIGLGTESQQALREFFQHERDKELGRWRWPENSDYVVYPSELYLTPHDADLVTVFNERTGQSAHCRREDDGNSGHFSLAARTYFAAHPEPKPEWHDAKPGEVWLLNYDGDDVPAIAVADEGSPSFQFGDSAGDPSRVGTEHPDIVDARRIWPEATPDQVGAA